MTPFALSAAELPIMQAIVQAYQDLAITPTEAIEAPHFSTNSCWYKPIKMACYQLGFVEQDAELIARAWSQKSNAEQPFNVFAWPKVLADLNPTPPSPTRFLSCPKNLGLYVVAPNAQWIEKLAVAGVKTLQLRFKSTDPAHIAQEVHQAVKAVQGFDCRLFINDHWQAAIEHQAYGIHLGQEDLAQADLPAIAHAGVRLGISTHGYAEIMRAVELQPSYIALGAIYPTTLKAMLTAPQGLGRLRLYAELLKDYSLVGIGGVSHSTIAAVIACGVGSVAVVRAVIGAEDYPQAIQALQAHFPAN